MGTPPFAAACAFTGGLAIMAAEMAFARQLAPWFGSSLPVWAVLISVLLLALALGAAWGGRHSLRPGVDTLPARLLLIAGGLLLASSGILPVLLAVAGSAHARGLLPALAAGGAALALAGAPMFLLGALSPALLAAIAPSPDHAGLIAGRLSAAATVGSLVGTLGTAFASLPWLGTRATWLVLGSLCLATGASAARRRRLPRSTVVTVLVLAATALVTPSASAPASRRTERIVDTVQTPYQGAFVLEAADGSRSLRLNSMNDRHSIYDPQGPSRQGVWPLFLLAQAVRPGCVRPPRRVLIIGLGAGTLARDLAFAFPAAAVVGVEIDPGVVALGRRWFALPPATEVHVQDGRGFLNRPAPPEGQRYDLILLDAFAGAYLPFQLATRESFGRLATYLAPGGAVGVNVLSVPGGDQLAAAVAATLAAVFPRVSRAEQALGYGAMLLAWSGTSDAPPPSTCAQPVHAGQRARLRELLPSVSPVSPDPRAIVLTDDRAPVEWLTHRFAWAALTGGVARSSSGRTP